MHVLYVLSCTFIHKIACSILEKHIVFRYKIYVVCFAPEESFYLIFSCCYNSAMLEGALLHCTHWQHCPPPYPTNSPSAPFPSAFRQLAGPVQPFSQRDGLGRPKGRDRNLPGTALWSAKGWDKKQGCETQSDPVTHKVRTVLVEKVEVKNRKHRERITGVSQTKIQSKRGSNSWKGSINTVERNKGERFTLRNILDLYQKKNSPPCRLAV